MTDNPLVSIVMATYNRAHLINESINSIVNQTYQNWECLIIDDGSNDNTQEIVSKYLTDERFTYSLRHNKFKKGLPGCRNQGIENSSGSYIIFFDDDDIVHPDNLLHCINNLKNTDFTFCRYIREVFTGDFLLEFDRSFNYSSFIITKNDIEKIIKHEIPFNSCAVMWRKTCFDSEKFNEDLMYAEEWELYQRIIANGATGISLNKVLFYGRKHQKSNTGEFYSKNVVRRLSKSRAIQLVANNLEKKNLLTPGIVKHLIHLGFFMKDLTVINYVAEKAGMTKIQRVKILFYFRLQPFVKGYLRLKKKLFE